MEGKFSSMRLPTCEELPQPPDPKAVYMQKSETKKDTVIILTNILEPLDGDLYDACSSENVKTVGELLKIKTNKTEIESSSHITGRNIYYLVLNFLLDNLNYTDSNSLFAIIKESLKNDKYGEALGYLLLTAGKKNWLNRTTNNYGHSFLTHVILNQDKENTGTKCMDTLLKYRNHFDINAKDNDGKTALHHAVDAGTKCMDTLMKYKQYFDIDAKDNKGNTALHYAVNAVQDNWTESTISKTLIKNGACINVKNKKGIHAMKHIPPNTIEDILNACIEEPNGSLNDRKNENYELKMDFSIFSHKESFDARNESEFIRALQSSQSHNHLLYHPLITTFLYIKWQKIKNIWYLNLTFNMLFFFLIFFYMFYCRKDLILLGIIDKKTNILTLKIVITTLGILLMVREIIQLKIFKWHYFKSFENYLEVAILVMTWVMLYTDEDIPFQQSIMAWLVVFISAELLLLFEKMHQIKMSLYISMFRKVTYNFVKLTILLLWMIMAFGVSFYLLIHIKSDDGTQNIINAQNGSQNGNQTMKEDIGEETQNKVKFAVGWKDAFLKTLIMSTGEFEFSELNFNYFPASRLLFAVFVFSIFLVGMNLLNGIAISDINIIQNDASKYHVRDQVECIINFDKLKPIDSWIFCLDIWKKGQIFQKCFPDKVLRSYPNRYKDYNVKCKGHKEPSFHCLKVYKWFKFLSEDCNEIKKLLRCNGCGEAKNICQGCRDQNRQDEQSCDYKHKFMIPHHFVTKAKLIKEKIKRKEQEDEKKKKLDNIEKCLEDILKHTKKS